MSAEQTSDATRRRTVRAVGRVITILALVATFVATLTPIPGNVVSFGFWCITCGDLGSLDFAANIIMFMPLGLGLALWTGRRWRTVAICMATTVFIEAMQVRVVAGRDSSLGDLVANTLGGWLGGELALLWTTIVWPRVIVARRLVVCWAVAFALVGLLTSFGLQPARVPASLWVQWTPSRSSYTAFTGRLLKFDVNGIDLAAPFPSAALGLQGAIGAEPWLATARIAPAGIENARSVIVRVVEETTTLISVEQRGSDLSCYQKTRSSDFRFRSPRAALANALRAGSAGDTAKLLCGRADRELSAAVVDRQGTRSETLRLSPSLGWLLVSPFDLPARGPFLWIGALWLIALALPGGYWLARALAERRYSVWLPGLLSIAALMVALVAGPTLARVAPGAFWEWAAALGGLILGAAMARVVPQRLSVDQAPGHAR